MDDPAIQGALAELLAQIEEAHVREVKAWCVVTIDDLTHKVVDVTGLWADPIDAIMRAAFLDSEDKRLNGDVPLLWSHEVVPFWERERES